MLLPLDLPDWLLPAPRPVFADDGAAMAWALALARLNIAEGGGPFAALVMREDGTLVAGGANRVVAGRNSALHAEMVALMLAQHVLGTHDLASVGRFTLVTTCAPCAMCLGAIPWAGLARVVCGARSEDAEAIGFDEGDKAEDWSAGLRRRDITVVHDVRRAEAADVLRDYVAQGHPLY